MSNPATDYLNDFFSDLNGSEELSYCCGATPFGELFKSFGRCSKCLEMTSFSDIRQECIESGEHMKRITPSGGYDVCFNCGGKE